MAAIGNSAGRPVSSFAPIESPTARVLILGSMPGQASLAVQRYYAHPQNAFWRILGEIFGFAPDADYLQRIAALSAAEVALWDVLQSCVRPGSLDANIARDSLIANDFTGFFQRHRSIARIGFNGAAAQQLYLRHVQPQLPPHLRHQHLRLPSTSPANASLNHAKKLDAWRALFPPVNLDPWTSAH